MVRIHLFPPYCACIVPRYFENKFPLKIRSSFMIKSGLCTAAVKVSQDDSNVILTDFFFLLIDRRVKKGLYPDDLNEE